MTSEQKNIPLESGNAETSMPIVNQKIHKVKCQCCKQILEPEDTIEKTEVIDSEGTCRRYSVCGYCGSDDIEDVVKCEGCDTYLTDYESETEGFCDNCIAELLERFAIVMEQFTPGEQLALETLGKIGCGET